MRYLSLLAASLFAAFALVPCAAEAQVVVSTQAIGGDPRMVVVNSAADKVYIARHAAGNVRVINNATGAVNDVDTSFFGAPKLLAIDPVSGDVTVGIEGGVFFIGGSTDAPVPGAGTLLHGPPFDLSGPLVNIVGIAINPTSGGNEGWMSDTANNMVWFASSRFGETNGPGVNCPGQLAANPVTANIYIAQGCGNSSLTVKTATFPFSAGIGLAADPVAVAVNPVTNTIYAALAGTSGVAVIDGATNTVTTTIASGFSSPNAIAVNPSTNKIYVTNAGTNDVTIINGAGNTTTTGIAPSTNPYGITIDNVRNRVYVANLGTNTVSAIDGATNAVTTVTVDSGPSSIAVNSLTSRVYVLSNSAGTLTTIDGRVYTHASISGSNALAAAVNPLTRTAYVALGGSPASVKVINTNNDAVVTTVTLTGVTDPGYIAVDPGSRRIYTSNKSAGTVSVIDGNTNTVVGTVAVESNPGAIVANPVTHKIYVAQPTQGHVNVIDGTNLGAGFTPVAISGSAPTALAVNVVTNKVYVADAASTATNAVIDGATLGVTTLPGSTAAASDVAVNPVLNRIYIARAGAGQVDEYDGAGATLLNSYPISGAASLAASSGTGLVYVANGASSVSVIDPVAVGVSTISLTESSKYVAVDDLSNRIHVSGTTRVFTIDGESAKVTTTVSPITVTAPGLPAVDSNTQKAYVPVPGGSQAIVVKESTSVAQTFHTLGPVAMAGGLVTSMASPTLSIPVGGNYAPSNPGVSTVRFSQDDLYASGTASSGSSSPFTAQLSGLSLGVHYATLVAVDTMSGTTTQSQSGTSGGTNFFLGRPLVFSLLKVSAPSIVTTTLPGGTEGIAYSQGVTATGGTGGNTFTLTGGALPDGLAIASNGAITGTPTLAGVYNFTVTVTDSSGGAGSQALSITIAAGTPVISASTTSISFADTIVGSPAVDQLVTVSNPGWGSLAIGTPGVTGTNAGDFSIVNSTCTGATLTHNQTCTFGVRFTPAGIGARAAVAGIPSNDGATPNKQITLSGTGLAASFLLTASSTGSGTGTITATGINCPGDCTESITSGTLVTLTATANAGSQFTSWAGCDSVTTNQCRVTMNAARTVTATFTTLFTLTAAASGSGAGTITATGINCPGDCTEPIPGGTLVTLTATPNGTSAFQDWTGCDSVTLNQCSVTMSGARTVTARFASLTFFSITLEGFQEAPYVDTQASGTASFTYNPVTRLLSYTYSFNNVSGSFTGATINGPAARGANGPAIHTLPSNVISGSDSVTLTADQETALLAGQLYLNVTMSENPQGQIRGQIDNLGPTAIKALTVSRDGTGNGVVVGLSEAGGVIVCGLLCDANVPAGKTVTFTPNPSSGSLFIGWSGACTGTGACTVTMDAAKSLTATFNLSTGPATVLAVSSTAVYLGDSVTLTASVSGASGVPTGNVIFQDGHAPLATVALDGTGHASLTTSSLAVGSHDLTVMYHGDLVYAAATSPAVQVTVSPLADIPRLFGISTRTQVLTGDNVMIAGFVIQGAAPKTVVVRARGPTLGVAGALSDPTLTLVPADGSPATANNDWQDAPNAAALQATGFQPADARESAIMATLNPGAYTAIVGGVGNTTGISIVEVYELDHPEIPLAGISTRGLVQTGDNVMIGGFAIQGAGPQTVVVRARGPSLGVAGALGDPVLTLVPADGSPALVNDDWQTAANAAQLQATGLQPGNTKESAMLLTLNPGAYTAIVSGAGGGSGVAIVEVYTLP